jgi:hypothetical protein
VQYVKRLHTITLQCPTKQQKSATLQSALIAEGSFKMQIQLLKANDLLVKTLEEAKKTYILTDLILKETQKEVSKLTAPIWQQIDNEMDNQNRDDVLTELSLKIGEIEKQHRLEERKKLYRLAGDCLINTAGECIKRISPEKWPEIKPVFDLKSDPCRFAVRDKIIELSLTVDPTH